MDRQGFPAITDAQPVTLLGAAGTGARALARALRRAPRLIAVDGGADEALRLGHRPERVIGDLDSISAAARAALDDRLVHVPTQDDTDFDKALDRVAAPMILALGFAGGRLDHTLAALSALYRRPGQRVILFAGRQIAFLVPPRLELRLAAGSLISLYPFAPVGCASRGLEWPTDGLVLDPAGMLGTSNRVAGGTVSLSPGGAALLCLVPGAALDSVLAALSDAPPWPGTAPGR